MKPLLVVLILAASALPCYASDASACADWAERLTKSNDIIRRADQILGNENGNDLAAEFFDGEEGKALREYQSAAAAAFQTLEVLKKAQRDAIYRLQVCADK